VLRPEDILRAYRVGIFPMADPVTKEVGWYSPEPRAVLPLEAIHVPRSTRRAMKKFTITSDRAFEAVIAGCADRRDSWISREILQGYVALHRTGSAHSVEAWQEGELAGGLYGVHIGGAFMGESMFHRRSEASKVALAALVEHLRRRGFVLLDTQMVAPVTAQFGAVEITRREYLRRLKAAVEREVAWDPFG
jgi:leucyl/phenylalanyl-tRNA--protein transferase